MPNCQPHAPNSKATAAHSSTPTRRLPQLRRGESSFASIRESYASAARFGSQDLLAPQRSDGARSGRWATIASQQVSAHPATANSFLVKPLFNMGKIAYLSRVERQLPERGGRGRQGERRLGGRHRRPARSRRDRAQAHRGDDHARHERRGLQSLRPGLVRSLRVRVSPHRDPPERGAPRRAPHPVAALSLRRRDPAAGPRGLQRRAQEVRSLRAGAGQGAGGGRGGPEHAAGGGDREGEQDQSVAGPARSSPTGSTRAPRGTS